MKLKSVLAAAAAFVGLSCCSVCAFAEEADEAQNEVQTPEDDAAAAAEAADPIEGDNPGTGVEGIAALTGIMAVAGAVLIISHKHERS